jgi:hypothetical protein
MAHPVTLSKTKLLDYAQCPRRLWLGQYRPELEEETPAERAAVATGLEVGAKAREVYGHGGGHYVTGERGLRAATVATRELLAAGGDEPIFEATFDYAGLTMRVDVLDRSHAALRIVEVKSSTAVKEHHVTDCAIQAWVLTELGIPVSRVVLAHVNDAFIYAGDGDYSGLFVEEDVTAAAREGFDALGTLVEKARATLEAHEEPAIAIGEQCNKPYACPFFAHCAPAQGEYPVTALGGLKARLYALMREGYRDVRDVPEARLANELEMRVVRQTKLGRAYVGAELRDAASALPRPRYYLDFETIAFAIPIWQGTRPYEALPFQWSVHIDDAGADESSGGLGHAAFLSLSGEPPMRACAETLIETLGRSGPVVVYSSYEKRVLNELIARFPDLAAPLAAIVKRLVDLLPLVKAHYYHPDMRGSWSLKAVARAVSSALDYERLGEVRDGETAQTAYLEAIQPMTALERRERLRRDLLEYCRHDTFALVELVAHFARAPV